jgi:hypothetical protein
VYGNAAHSFGYPGTPQYGNMIKEADGSFNVYLSNATGPSVNATARSWFQDGNCFVEDPFQVFGFPVTTVMPVSALGVAPFSLK